MHKFDPAKIARLVSAERTEEMAPEAFLRSAGLSEGDIFADIGCGPGFYALPAAQIVGEKGRVYAVDTQEEMLEHLSRRDPPANVVPVNSTESSIPLEDSSADFVLAAFVLHEAADPAAFLREIKRLMRPGARFLLVDWQRQSEERGPPEEERIAGDEAARLVEEAGFSETASALLGASYYTVSALKARGPGG